MKYSKIVMPRVAEGFVSHSHALGVATYDLDDVYSPDTDRWKSTVLKLGSPKYPPQQAANPTRYEFDRSRYCNHGTITGATWVQLPSGIWVLSLDGSDDFIDAGANTCFDTLTNGYTLMAWFKLSSLSNKSLLFHKKLYEASLSDAFTQFNMEANRGTGANNHCCVIVADGTNQKPSVTTMSPSASVWYFQVGVFDPVTALPTLYVFSTAALLETVVGVSALPGSPYVSAGSLKVGKHQNASNVNGWFPGLIGERRIILTNLNLADITTIWNNTRWGYL